MTLAAIGITVAAIWFVARQTNFAELKAAFAAADYTLLPVFLVVLTAFYVLKAWRWALLLRPLGRYRVAELWRSMMAGFAFNNLLPAHLGEFVRMEVLARETDLTRGAVLSTIALERLFDVLAILMFLSIGLLGVADVSESLRQTGYAFLAASIVVAAGAVWYVFDTARVVGLTCRVFDILPLPSVIGRKVVGLAESGAEGLGSLRQPSLLIGVLSLSVVKWALNGAMIFLTLKSFAVPVGYAMSALVLAAVAFGVTLPSTPGYFGVLQGAFVLALTSMPSFELYSDRIVAASIYYHALQWVPVTLVGLIGFRQSGVKLAAVRDRPH